MKVNTSREGKTSCSCQICPKIWIREVAKRKSALRWSSHSEKFGTAESELLTNIYIVQYKQQRGKGYLHTITYTPFIHYYFPTSLSVSLPVSHKKTQNDYWLQPRTPAWTQLCRCRHLFKTQAIHGNTGKAPSYPNQHTHTCTPHMPHWQTHKPALAFLSLSFFFPPPCQCHRATRFMYCMSKGNQMTNILINRLFHSTLLWRCSHLEAVYHCVVI